MQRIADYIHRSLKWEQPSAFKMGYLLHSGEETVAALRFRSSWGTLASAESADGAWTFKRVGFFNTRVTVRASGSEQDIALFHPNTWSGGGTLELPDGRQYKATTNFWQTKLEFQDSAGQVLISFETGGFFRLSAQVEISPAAADLPELPWMVLLSWYLFIMIYNDSAAAATAAAAT